MSDTDLAIALINALAECRFCGGVGSVTLSYKGKPQKCPKCGGNREFTPSKKANELLAEWRKKYPKL